MKRFLLFIAVPITASLIAAFFGTFLPVAVYDLSHGGSFELHNVTWEIIFGIGYYAAALVCYVFSFEYALNRPVGLVGGIIWPLCSIVLVFIVTRHILRGSPRTRLIWSALFLLSLFVCVGRDGEKWLAMHGVPVYWTYEAVFF